MNAEKAAQHRVPPCPRCRAPCSVELQIMPTSLYFLHSDRFSTKEGDDGTDFATVTVYTCSKQCTSSKKGVLVMQEHVFVEAPPSLDASPSSTNAAAQGQVAFRDFLGGEDAQDGA